MRQLVICVCLASLAQPLRASDLVERFLSRDEAPVTRFAAWRRLEARNERFKASAWLEACVAQDPLDGFTFAITAEGGSSYIRNKVLRKALEGERDTIQSGAPGRAALSSINYDLALSSSAPAALGEAAIVLRPRRRDTLLLDGRAIVTDPEGDLLRVEGRLVKSPSFWTRSVHVVRRYARVAGTRVAVDTESTADVRIAGRSHFRMRSIFVSLNGAAVENAPEAARAACLVTQN